MYLRFFFNNAKVSQGNCSRFADVQGVKDLYNSPFPHLRMKGMGKCETQPLMILRVIKIVWEYSSWEYTGWEFSGRIYRKRVWWVGVFWVGDFLELLQIV